MGSPIPPMRPSPAPPKGIELLRYPEIKRRMEELALAVSDWACEYCETKNITDERRCIECGAPKKEFKR